MDEMEITQPEEIVEAPEATEAPAVEEQVLEEATYEADAHVEQSGSYEESEAVETAMTEVVDSIIEEPAQMAVEEPKRTQEVDPVTGQSKPSGGGSEETGTEEEEPSLVVVDEDQSDLEAPAEAVADTDEEVEDLDQTVVVEEADAASDAAEARREGEEYGDTTATAVTGDEKPGAQTVVVEEPTGIVGDEGVDIDQIEQPQIERQLPEEEILAAGMDKQGLMPGAPSGKGAGPPSGKGTSGGGLPVGQFGAGSVGEDPDKIEYDPNWEEGDDEDSIGRDLELLEEWAPEEIPAYLEGVMDRQTDIAIIMSGGEVALTLDGGTPMPYTGSTYGGAPTDLSHKPPAGPDECGFLRMLTGGGRAAKSYYGYGSSGSATFSPSGGGDTDDSGKYYGGLFGGGSIQDVNPDDFDYYTPNVLAEALEKLQKEREE